MGHWETIALAVAEWPLGYHPCDIGILTCGSESSRHPKIRPELAEILEAEAAMPGLAELEADGKLHLSLVYRGDEKSAGQFLEAQNQILTELYPPEDMEGEAEENEALDHSDKEPEETKAEEQEESEQGETEESEVE